MRNHCSVISSRASVLGGALWFVACGNTHDRALGDVAGGSLTAQNSASNAPGSAGTVEDVSKRDEDDAANAEVGAGEDSTPAVASVQPTGSGSSAGSASESGSSGPLDLSSPPAEPSGPGEPSAQPASSCVGNPWPAADPTSPGPFQVTTETNVGPKAGALPDLVHGDEQPQFNVYRPADLARGGFCHPIITWGNGHSDQPRTYEVLLKQLASHGFVVIASLSSIVSQGNPPPMSVGVSWLIQENDNPSSEFFHHLDTTHVGATGHSEGGAATTNAGADPNVLTIATIAGASGTPKLHGPGLFQCGGKDTQFPCSRIMPAFNAVNDQPVMLLVNLNATHGSWIGSIKDPYMEAVTAWMRLQLMGDTALRGMFFGSSCELCQDSRVQVMRKLMDQ
jgi:hypothetical protein